MPELRIIAGSGRSGTTWVLDNLGAVNDLRPIFEPLHPVVSAVGERFAHRMLRPGEDHPELEAFLTRACSPGFRSMWMTYRGRPDLLFPSWANLLRVEEVKRLRRRWAKFMAERPQLSVAARRPYPIIKFIRANLMLGWLRSVFDCKVVLMVRHPGAVVESQLRLGSVWNPEPVLQRYRSDRRLDELTAGRYRTLLNAQLTPVQALTLNWVIENQWPIDNCAGDGVSLVFYENLRSTPETGWRQLCRLLDLANVPSVVQLRRPSQQSSSGSWDGTTSDANEPRWRKRLTRAQLDELQGVLDEVGFRAYHVDRAGPLLDGSVHAEIGSLGAR